MKSHETTDWSLANAAQTGTRKFKQFLYHPFTFIVLVWVFLWLAFYVASEFI